MSGERRRYLVVAHQTGDSPMLLEKVRELTDGDPSAEFVLLTPRRPVTMQMLVAGETRTATQVAVWRAKRTRRRLEAAGANVVASKLGGYDAWHAVDEELRYHPADGVLISTLRPGLSAWLRQDLPSRIRQHWPGVELIHVVTPSPFHLEREAGVGA